MDAVKQITMVEHIRKRLGMYWPTHDAIPDASVWISLRTIRSTRQNGKRMDMAERTSVLRSFMLRNILKSSRRALSTSPMATAPRRGILRLIRFFGF